MAERDRPHLIVREPAAREPYRGYVSGRGGKRPSPPPDRLQHAQNLVAALERARQSTAARREELAITMSGAVAGTYVVFSSHPDFHLILKSLESKGKGIELLNVVEDGPVERATVFVPDGTIGYFLQRFEDYALKQSPKGKPKNAALVESIADLRQATVEALWTDAPDVLPAPEEWTWFEVWLRRRDGRELERLAEFAEQNQVRLGPRRIVFDERVVCLARASLRTFADSLAILDDLAELRLAKESAQPYVEMTNAAQADWLRELLSRVHRGSSPSYVCVLDTGVNAGHPLLEAFVAPPDLHAVDPAWGSHDHDGHGTEMAGLALFGDLAPVLRSGAPVAISHRLESVKILPPPGFPDNRPELYGSIVAEAASRVEITDPRRLRTFSMAVAATDGRDRGQPTSWSSAIDALAAGRSFDPTDQGLRYLASAEAEARRLFVLSAGNVAVAAADHLSVSDTEAVHDPGQAWNAVTVGACTDIVELDPGDPSLAGWSAAAEIGELSPFSTTGVLFASEWPHKPDVVMEGGNGGVPPNDVRCFTVDSLGVLTTGHEPARSLFVPSWGTSPASAQAAGLAATIWAANPSFWPETVRGLIVHSARWSARMTHRFQSAKTRQQTVSLVRRYGFGVPDLSRALRSARNALTLIAQDSIRPFERSKMREMNVHQLPWPERELRALFGAEVHLRVTLSYFIEPNPARRGWRDRHRYASHGLRFELRRPGESIPDFRKRLNKLALEDGEARPKGASDASQWLLGPWRNKGSLHSDIWTGTASDLADRGFVGIVPASGWWKDQPRRDRSEMGARYSLIVSIETDEEEVDIWTPVAQMVGVPVTT